MNTLQRLKRIFSAGNKKISASEYELLEFQEKIEEVNFHFRKGFALRVVARLNNIGEVNPIDIYYRNLSGLFPKIVGFAFVVIILMGIVIFALHGTLSPNKFLGVDRVNENNFITYLILE